MASCRGFMFADLLHIEVADLFSSVPANAVRFQSNAVEQKIWQFHLQLPASQLLKCFEINLVIEMNIWKSCVFCVIDMNRL